MNALTSRVLVEFYHLNMIIDLSHTCIYTYRNASAFILQNTLFRNAYGNNKIQRQPKMTKKKFHAVGNRTKNNLQTPLMLACALAHMLIMYSVLEQQKSFQLDYSVLNKIFSLLIFFSNPELFIFTEALPWLPKAAIKSHIQL